MAPAGSRSRACWRSRRAASRRGCCTRAAGRAAPAAGCSRRARGRDARQRLGVVVGRGAARARLQPAQPPRRARPGARARRARARAAARAPAAARRRRRPPPVPDRRGGRRRLAAGLAAPAAGAARARLARGGAPLHRLLRGGGGRGQRVPGDARGWPTARGRSRAATGWPSPARWSASSSWRAAELDRGDALRATLDCTGGFYAEREWRGVALAALLDEAGAPRRPRPRDLRTRAIAGASPPRMPAAACSRPRVGGEPLSHGHGAPVRLVAPGRRGFQWVKWVTRIEVHDGPDPGAPAVHRLELVHARGARRRLSRWHHGGVDRPSRRTADAAAADRDRGGAGGGRAATPGGAQGRGLRRPADRRPAPRGAAAAAGAALHRARAGLRQPADRADRGADGRRAARQPEHDVPAAALARGAGAGGRRVGAPRAALAPLLPRHRRGPRGARAGCRASSARGWTASPPRSTPSARSSDA